MDISQEMLIGFLLFLTLSIGIATYLIGKKTEKLLKKDLNG